ncbi:hypothetical protein [Pseudoxanthomonas suwonensis]|uniref:hypothetical protein n=1 Tax=Pseudoxanthomonas suwonensis TaxID=314722 RepID=UPI00048B1DB0|nr:hypothetical protein [Pseudoxanthomonas suwonensis]
MVRSPRSIRDYDTLFNPVREARLQRSGKPPGDPAKAAWAMLEVIESDSPPTHLLLGSDALELVRARLAGLAAGMAEQEALTRSTDG